MGTWDELVVVSNRLPFTLKGALASPQFEPVVSGLVTAVEPVLRRSGGVWIGWGGRTQPPAEGMTRSFSAPNGAPYRLLEVDIPEAEFGPYYHGLANGALWPLCHHFVERAAYTKVQWEAYQAVNRRFARAAEPWAGDRLTWVHDFHLALVPEYIRSSQPNARLAFFWHIPFPPEELWVTLPWARQLLSGLLGSDLIAFHTADYARNFLRSAGRHLGVPVDEEAGLITWRGRSVRVAVLPVGVEWESLAALADSPRIRERAQAIRAAAGTDVVLLAVDRMDYTKGIPERLFAFDRLLERYPEFRNTVTLLQVGVPTRDAMAGYRELRRKVEAAVGYVNGRHSRNWRMPVRFQTQSLGREELVAHYLAADVAVVTPLRDGLNLVAKEYIASRVDDRGALVLSPFAGAAVELPEAFRANPYDVDDLAERLRLAITQTATEQMRRMRALRRRVRERDLSWWWEAMSAALGLPPGTPAAPGTPSAPAPALTASGLESI